jgi:hypothetical protein
MKTTTLTMTNILNMNNIRNLIAPMPAYAQSTALPLPGMAYIPKSWLEVSKPARSQKADRSGHPASASLWVTLPQENIAEKALLGLLVAGAAIGICYGFALALDYIQALPALHSLAIQ